MKFIYILIMVFSIITGIYLLSDKEKEPINITVSSWTGYMPIFYAKEKGWLDTLNINILHVSTLNESLKFYKAGLCDGLATTNDIAIKLQKTHQLIPVMVLDRSDGGDKVLSNISLDQIKVMQDEIDVYLEMDSVNLLVFEGFIKYYDLNKSRYKLHNMNQNFLTKIEPSDKPKLFITYDPFSSILKQENYQEIASSKLSTINIIDLLLIKESVYHKYPNAFKQLRKSINRAIKNLEKDPYEFYKTVEYYLEGQSYETFLGSLSGIELIKTASEDELYLHMHKTKTKSNEDLYPHTHKTNEEDQ